MQDVFTIIADLMFFAGAVFFLICIFKIGTRRAAKEKDRWQFRLMIFWPMFLAFIIIEGGMRDGKGLGMSIGFIGILMLIWYPLFLSGRKKCESCGHGPFKQRLFAKICPHCGEAMKQKK